VTDDIGRMIVARLDEVIAELKAMREGREPQTGGLIGLAEAAKYLGYKPPGLRKLAKRGLIRYVQNGRGPLRFKRQWLDEFIASNNPQGLKRSPARRRKPPAVTVTGINAAALGFNPSLYKHNRFPESD
jgi:excisionase family DNA binding protein